MEDLTKEALKKPDYYSATAQGKNLLTSPIEGLEQRE